MSAGQKFEATPEILEQVEHWASRGLTQEQIAHCLHITPGTISRHKAANELVAQAIKRGIDTGIGEVTNALFENAMAGNLGAQCFYLKNRDKYRWRDQHDLTLSGELGVFEIIDYTGTDPDASDDSPEAA